MGNKFNNRLIKLEQTINRNQGRRDRLTFEDIVFILHYIRSGNNERLAQFPAEKVENIQQTMKKIMEEKESCQL